MAQRWAVDIAEAFKQQPADIELSFGEIISTKPLIVKTKDAEIKKNLFINPAYLVSDEATIAKIFDDELRIPVHVPVFSFLKEFHVEFVLKVGDIVSVAQAGKNFYILEKVVRQ